MPACSDSLSYSWSCKQVYSPPRGDEVSQETTSTVTCKEPNPDGGNFFNCLAYHLQVHLVATFTDKDPSTYDCDSAADPICGVPDGAGCPFNCTYACAPDGTLFWPDGTVYTGQFPTSPGVTYTFSCPNYNCVIQYIDYPRERGSATFRGARGRGG